MTRRGVRETLETRRRKRDASNVAHGRKAGWAEEALDMYLAGFDVQEIRECFNNVGKNSFYNAIAKAALYRLMVQHQAQRLEEIPELNTEENK